MARKKRLHTRSELGNQPDDCIFLSLPREVRNLIYTACLTKSTPIDLCPPRTLTDDEVNALPELRMRLEKARERASHDRYPQEMRFRFLEDLVFVRKEMATGLLGTCSQIYDEAWPAFWRDNTWRFSDDGYGRNLRSWLTTIGPRALSQIRTLEIGGIGAIDERTIEMAGLRLSYLYKNHPKLRMNKSNGGFSIQDECSAEFIINLFTHHNALTCQLREVRFLIPENAMMLERRFLDIPNQMNHWGLPNNAVVPERHLHDDWYQLGGWLRISLVFQRGSRLAGNGHLDFLRYQGLNVICEKGSFAPTIDLSSHRDLDDSEEMPKTVVYPACTAPEDYLLGLRSLFEPVMEVSPARSGKALASTPCTTARILKGFGGCRFESANRWYCMNCGQKPSKQLYDRHGNPYYPSPRNCQRPVWNDPRGRPVACVFVHFEGVVLKKDARARAKGILEGQTRVARWQT